MANPGLVIYLLALAPERRALDGVGEEHLLREDQVRARVVGELVVVAHRDRVERARDLAVAAEDAAAHVDLVDLGVALAGRDRVVRRLLLGVLDRDRPLDEPPERRAQAPKRLAEGAVGAADPARLRPALDL